MRSLDVTVDPWLGRLLDEVDEAAAGLDGLGQAIPSSVAAAHDSAAVATLRLDGSPILHVPDLVITTAAGTGTGPAAGGWLEVLRGGTRSLTTVPDEVLLAVEHRGARTGLGSSDLAERLRPDLEGSLTTLHTRVTDGLLHPDVAGRARVSDQAVHDASRGRVLFFPVDPAVLGARLDRLGTWFAGSDDHAVVRSGVLHHQLLDIHPYEAANGRLARIASRLSLAAEGIDPSLLGQPERALLGDPIGYLDEVARSRRLGNPGSFVTRWAEALVDGLLGVLEPLPFTDVPAATSAFLVDIGDEEFTLVDHRRAVGGADSSADEDLDRARRAGLARRVHGSRGLRWRRTTG